MRTPGANRDGDRGNSQNERIARFLKRGRTLTSLSAMNLFGTMRLAARVNELKRRGLPIVSEQVRLSNGKRIARYSLSP